MTKREVFSMEQMAAVLEFCSIPCGLSVYRLEGGKISPIFHNPVFYDIMGYSDEHIRSVEQEMTYLGVNPDDLKRLKRRIEEVLSHGGIVQETYRVWNDKRQEERYIHLEGTVRDYDDGSKMLYGVYTDVSEQKRLEKELLSANEKMQETINAIPGGVASYRVEGMRFIPTFFSDGVTVLSGHNREEYEEMVQHDVLDIIYELDRERVFSAVRAAYLSGEVLDISYRMRHKDGHLIWIHLNGRRIGQLSGEAMFYAVFTGMSPESRLFQSIADGTADGIYVIDKSNYELLYANESDNLFGKGTDSLGQKCYAALYGKSSPCEFCVLKEGGDSGEEHEMEVPETGRFYSARFREIDWNGIPSYVKYLRDITDDVLIRREKERLRHQYEEVIFQHYQAPGPDTLLIGHCSITQNRILEYRAFRGREFVKTLGKDREQFFAGIARCIVDAEERKAFLQMYHNAPLLKAYAENDTERVMECFIRLPQTKGCYARFKVSLVEVPDTGDLTGVLTVTDITDQTIADRILHQLSLTSHDFIIDVDLLEDSFHVLSSSADSEWMLGRQRHYSSQVVHLAETMVTPGDREHYKRALDAGDMRQRLQKEGSYTFTYGIADEKGDVRTKSVVVSSIDLRLGRVSLVCTDVTDMLAAERRSQKKLEEALTVAEKANQAKSEFLSSMSHDIRTPMNAIMGMTTLAEANIDDRERVRDCLHKISISSRHLLNLINDVLDMSKIERSQITLNPSRVYLSEILDEITAIIGPQAQAAGLQVEFLADGITHNCFCGDTLRVNQILLNLLSNAVKFTPEGGRVGFLAEEILPIRDAGHIRYRFTVSDTGIGMSEEFLEHIFDPFVRADRVAGIEGTGLGLSITRGLADLMDGEISIESSLGSGSVFRVELEFEEAQERTGAAKRRGESARISGDSLEGYYFLIVEDNAINAEILSEILAMHKARSVVKTDGAQAVQEFKKAPPGTYDAILMDIQMPVMNGYEATRAIRAMERADAAAIPIIAMTANAFDEDIKNSLDAGMDAHVAKPVDIVVLLQTLNQALARKAAKTE